MKDWAGVDQRRKWNSALLKLVWFVCPSQNTVAIGNLPVLPAEALLPHLVLLLQPVHSECCCFLGGSYLRGGKGPHLCQCWTNFCFCFEWSNVPFCRWGFQCHVMFRSLTFFLIKVMQSKSEGFCAGNMGAQQWQRDVVDYFFLCV